MLSWRQQRIVRYGVRTAVPILIAIGIASILTLRDDTGEISLIWSDTTNRAPHRLEPDSVTPYETFEREIRTTERYGRMSRQVLGFYPFWMEKRATVIRHDLLTHLAYFSYELDPLTGNAADLHSWPSVRVTGKNRDNGPSLLLTVTNFGADRNRMFLENAGARARLIKNLAAFVGSGDADGINIDFEIVPRVLRDSLTLFMAQLASELRSVVSSAHLSIDLPGIDRESAFDVKKLGTICDYLVVMGYDYYHQGSAIAGPVAPLDYDGKWRKEHIRSAVEFLVRSGVDSRRILLGIPLYGYEWRTVSDTAGSSTIQQGRPRYYTSIRSDSAFRYRREDSHSGTAWTVSRDGSGWRQIWFEDSASLARKYRFVDSANLGGIALWALGYDGGRPEIWNGILDAFLKVDTIRFDRHFPLAATITGRGTRGVSRFSRRSVHRHRGRAYLQLDILDSLASAHSWRVPVPLHDYLVLPRDGAILFRTRCGSAPAGASLRCVVRYRGQYYETAAQKLVPSRGWREFSFPLSSLPDSARKKFRSDSRYRPTLHAIILESPGHSERLRVLINNVTAKAFSLPRRSVLEEFRREGNTIIVRPRLHGDEVRELYLQRYDETSSRWLTREWRVLRPTRVLSDTLTDTMDGPKEFWYRIMVVDGRGNRIVMATKRFWNGPVLAVAGNSAYPDSILVRVTIPAAGEYRIELVSSDGVAGPPLVLSERGIGDHLVEFDARNLLPVSGLRGIYFIRVRSAETAIVRKMFRIR